MKRRPPRSTRTNTPFPDTTLFRSLAHDTLSPPRETPLGRYCRGLRGGVKGVVKATRADAGRLSTIGARPRSEEHTSELQSLMRISYAVFCLKKKRKPEWSHEPRTCQFTQSKDHKTQLQSLQR